MKRHVNSFFFFHNLTLKMVNLLNFIWLSVVCYVSACAWAHTHTHTHRENLVWSEKPQKGKGTFEKSSLSISQLLVSVSTCSSSCILELPKEYDFLRCPLKSLKKTSKPGTSLVAQWLRIRLPMQGTRVWALVWEDPICRRAAKPARHNYWTCALDPASHKYWAHVPQLLKPVHLEPMLRNKRSNHNEKPMHRNKE